jgi:hypothetical protein
MPSASTSLEIIDGKAVQSLVDAHAIRGATVLGQRGGWAVLVRYGAYKRVVAAQRSRRPRLWRNLATAAAYVREELGLARFEVDAQAHEPDAAARRRPDQTERLRLAHEAAEHDRWFREQVEIGLKEADDPKTVWVPHEDVKADMARQRAELQARLETGAK